MICYSRVDVWLSDGLLPFTSLVAVHCTVYIMFFKQSVCLSVVIVWNRVNNVCVNRTSMLELGQCSLSNGQPWEGSVLCEQTSGNIKRGLFMLFFGSLCGTSVVGWGWSGNCYFEVTLLWDVWHHVIWENVTNIFEERGPTILKVLFNPAVGGSRFLRNVIILPDLHGVACRKSLPVETWSPANCCLFSAGRSNGPGHCPDECGGPAQGVGAA